MATSHVTTTARQVAPPPDDVAKQRDKFIGDRAREFVVVVGTHGGDRLPWRVMPQNHARCRQHGPCDDAVRRPTRDHIKTLATLTHTYWTTDEV